MRETQYYPASVDNTSKLLYELRPNTPLWNAIHKDIKAQKQFHDALLEVRNNALSENPELLNSNK